MNLLHSSLLLLVAAAAAGAVHSQVQQNSEAVEYFQGKPVSRLRPTGYIRLAGQSGVSIEVPNDWRVLSTQELVDAGKLRPAVAKGQQLEIFAAAQRVTSGALISVAVQRPPQWTQRLLASVSEATLRATSEQLQREFKGKRSQSGIGSVVSGPTYELRVLPGTANRAIALTYREEELSPKGRSLIWKTTHLHLPRASDELEIVLSYRESDEAFWRPVIEHAATSLRY